MGFDIVGRDPSSEIGAHFGMTVDGWPPLADYITETVPEIAAKCRHWYFNDGDGLDAPDAKTLANALEAELASGRCMAYARSEKGTDGCFAGTDRCLARSILFRLRRHRTSCGLGKRP